jgi:hypothetical protein
MKDQIFNHLNSALKIYTRDEYRDALISAKHDFFKITGNLNDDDEDYDLRMHSFNDWYLMQFCLLGQKRTPIADYIFSQDIEESVATVLLNYKHSLFQFTGEKRNGAAIFRNLCDDKNMTVKDKSIAPMFVKGDIFLARYFELSGEVIFMSGLCVIPREVKAPVVRELLKMKGRNSKRDEQSLMLRIEYLKTKSLRYSHLALNKIFSF